MAEEKYVIGVDYGSLSGRAVVVRISDGEELASAVHEYEHAVMAEELTAGPKADAGTPVQLPPDWALQVPQDYRNVLMFAVPEAVKAAGIDPNDVVGIGTDFTACTMIPVKIDGTPLCELPEFADNPHAYVKLWKHHAGAAQAWRITQLAHDRNESWIKRYGGQISSEWEFAKGLQILEEDKTVYDAMDKFVEAADWIIWQLTGEYIRNACTAGYKGQYQDGEYPSKDYLKALNPDFENFVEDKIEWKIGELGQEAGKLSKTAAVWTGLPEGISVAVGNVDAHVTAPAANACEPGQMVAIMGTSTCNVMNGTKLVDVPGICGVVDGGITKGFYGYEAGQSGVGDIFGWFVDNSVSSEYQDKAHAEGMSVHEYLTELAAKQNVGEHGLLALDWHSGNRSVLVDQRLSGLILGLTLQTKPEDQYRALIEATAFGARKIVETFNQNGVPVTEYVISGGLIKNKMLMQIYSDVLNMPLSITVSKQGPALGSAIHAAVAAGFYPDVISAAKVMGKKIEKAYSPIPENVEAYNVIYDQYSKLHDYFGRLFGSNNETENHNPVMHYLKDIKDSVFKEKEGK